ncbi:zinc ribbon domain-containing protein [Chloroflexota bacterium]
MPIYEYECKKCGRKFELRRSINDADAEIKCPGCGGKSAKRLLSLFGTASTTAGGAPTGSG